MQEYQQKRLAIIYLNYKSEIREALKEKVLQSLAGYPLIEVNELGISNAINIGMKQAFESGADNVLICANDIEMPTGSIEAMLNAAESIPNTGMVACYCVEHLPAQTEVNGITIHPAWGVFGNSLITKQAFETVGYWNLDHDPYKMNDSDYCYRLHKAGLLNYYIGGYKAIHLDNDAGSKTDYRLWKDESLSKALPIFNQWKEVYDKGQWYLPYEQENYLINMQQWQSQNI